MFFPDCILLLPPSQPSLHLSHFANDFIGEVWLHIPKNIYLWATKCKGLRVKNKTYFSVS